MIINSYVFTTGKIHKGLLLLICNNMNANVKIAATWSILN